MFSELVSVAAAGTLGGVSAGAGLWLSRRIHGGDSASVVWFELWSAPGQLFGAQPSRRVDANVLRCGLRLDGRDPGEHGGRRGPGELLLLPPSSDPAGRTLIGVPASAAPRVPWAAAAVGVLTAPSSTAPAPDGASAVSGPLEVVVPAAPAWRLRPARAMAAGAVHPEVLVNFVPGATVAVTGHGAHLLAQTLPRAVPWLRAIGDLTSPEQPDLAEQWRRAWDPQVCRVVITESVLPAEIFADLVVDASGALSCCGQAIPLEILLAASDPAASDPAASDPAASARALGA